MAKKKKPRLLKDGVPVDTVDAKISKLSEEDLNKRIEDAQSNLNTLMAEKDRRKQEALAEFRSKAKELGFALTPLGEKKAKESDKERQPRSCKKCKSLGLDDLASGHIERGHDKWLAKQPQSVKDRVATAEA